MEPKETKMRRTDDETLKNWWITQGTANNQEIIKLQIRQVCGWSRNVWFNKLHGYTEISHLEKQAINKITKKQVFEIENLID